MRKLIHSHKTLVLALITSTLAISHMKAADVDVSLALPLDEVTAIILKHRASDETHRSFGLQAAQHDGDFVEAAAALGQDEKFALLDEAVSGEQPAGGVRALRSDGATDTADYKVEMGALFISSFGRLLTGMGEDSNVIENSMAVLEFFYGSGSTQVQDLDLTDVNEDADSKEATTSLLTKLFLKLVQISNASGGVSAGDASLTGLILNEVIKEAAKIYQDPEELRIFHETVKKYVGLLVPESGLTLPGGYHISKRKVITGAVVAVTGAALIVGKMVGARGLSLIL